LKRSTTLQEGDGQDGGPAQGDDAALGRPHMFKGRPSFRWPSQAGTRVPTALTSPLSMGARAAGSGGGRDAFVPLTVQPPEPTAVQLSSSGQVSQTAGAGTAPQLTLHNSNELMVPPQMGDSARRPASLSALQLPNSFAANQQQRERGVEHSSLVEDVPVSPDNITPSTPGSQGL
jgi:hypothetical protein